MSRTNEKQTAPLMYRPLFQALSKLQVGIFLLKLPNGVKHQFQGVEKGPTAELHIKSPRVMLRLLTNGTLGLAESYMAGEWDSPDVVSLITVGEMNRSILGGLDHGRWWMRSIQWLVHATRANTRSGAKKNIASHYDLGNDFYALWLDPTMTYSSAVFQSPDQDLKSAQINKYDTILEILRPTEHSHILEIGSGWGGFAMRAVQTTGCTVTSITLSEAQLKEASARVQAAGLADRITFKLQDYRDVKGQFDGIASIEMFEAVGERYWPAFFNTLHDRLRPDSMAAVQVITIRDDLFAAYRKGVDFIQRYIFPGGMLPSPEVFLKAAQQAGLGAVHQVFRGLDYARTLHHWDHQFNAQLDRIRAMGFDEHFIRMWHFYLAYCEAGFRRETINLMQIGLRRA